MKKLILFLKGMLMGICDVIPGVSGGTIAFITGIYDQLINSVKSFSPKLVGNLFKYALKRDKKTYLNLKEDVKNLDLVFLIMLFLGIGIAIFIGSGIITFLLDNHFTYTIAFFIGLILASSKVIYNNIKRHHKQNILFGVIGLLIGILLSILIPVQITPTLPYILLAGFLAISAMFLPGISGAFILLILGVYEFMLGVIHNVRTQISFFIVFMLGAVLGAFTISRVISFLFKKDRCKTLYVLLGLVIGSLSIPIKRVFQSNSTWSLPQIIITIVFLLMGFFIVGFISKMENNKKWKE